MKIQDLLEARKNPEMNPKISTNAVLLDYVQKFGANSFISFTTVDKLGINPGSDFGTPLGIYAYPGKYATQLMGEHRPAAYALPFAGSAAFATLFTASNGVIDLGTFSESDYKKAIEDLKKAYPKNIKQVVEADKWASDNAFVRSPGGRFWAMTMQFASFIRGNSTPVTWNKIFRSIGVNGCVDSKGQGIIHTNEPTQAVFFKKPGVIENEKRVLNKYAPERVKNRIKTGQQTHADVVALGKLRKKDFLGYLKEMRRQGTFNRLTQSELDVLPLETIFCEIYTFSPEEVQAALKDPASSIGEDVINVGIGFTNNLAGKRWKAFEPLLFRSPSSTPGIRYLQSRKMKQRDPNFEKKIISSVYNPDKYHLTYDQAVTHAIMYATDVIKMRWPEAEKAIMNTLENRQNDPTVDDEDDSEVVYDYARRVIHGAWPEAEHLIIDETVKRMYARFVKNNTPAK